MFKTSQTNPSDQQTVIARGVKVEGDFVSEGSVIIEGDVAGSVHTAGNLSVGKDAHIDADVSAAEAVIAGEVSGNIRIEGSLELTETSKIHGDIEAHILSVAAGSRLNGRVVMNGEKKGKKADVKKDVQELNP